MTTHVTGPATAEVGVIGGSGFYHLLADAEPVTVHTPYGDPSDAVSIGTVAGRRVAFLLRHGAGHSLPPHRSNYRANLWALRSLGVRQVPAPCAVGSLRRELGPGSVVVPDQLVDRTNDRVQTYYERGAVHVSFADPYCAASRTAALGSVWSCDLVAAAREGWGLGVERWGVSTSTFGC
jgi:5'-methylthioadenosine phosphorylase